MSARSCARHNVLSFFCLIAGFIHADLNTNNILIRRPAVSPASHDAEYLVDGVIDISDSMHSHIVYDIAIAICHFTLAKGMDAVRLLRRGAAILRGFRQVVMLNPAELHALKYLIILRRLTVFVMGKHLLLFDPGRTVFRGYEDEDQQRQMEILWNCDQQQLADLWDL